MTPSTLQSLSEAWTIGSSLGFFLAIGIPAILIAIKFCQSLKN